MKQLQCRPFLLLAAACLLGGGSLAFSLPRPARAENISLPPTMTTTTSLFTDNNRSDNHHHGTRRTPVNDNIRGGAVAARHMATTSTENDDDDSKKNHLQGITLMALSSLSFSVMFLGVKLFSDAPTFTLIFYRSVVQAILSGGALLLNRKKKKSTAASIQTPSNDNHNVQLLLLFRAAFGSIAVAAFFYAVQHLPLPDAITLQFTTPVFAALLAVPLLHEKWKRSDQVGAAVCMTGVLMIARPSWLFGNGAVSATAATATTTVPTLIGLLGALFAGLAYVLVRKIGARADANTMVFYYALFSTLTAPLGSKLLGGSNSWDVMSLPTTSNDGSAQQLLVFLGLGLFGFFGQLFTNQGLQQCESAAIATLISNTQIVFAFMFEVLILKEGLSPWSLAGTALIVGYMAFVGIGMVNKGNAAIKKKLE